MVNVLRYNAQNEFNDSFIHSLRQPVGHPDTRAYLNPADADEKQRIDEERRQDWRRNMAKIRNRR
jgi:hypothetical protein